ncbi:hypothetical protein LCGC14_2155640, partial [marine sediment metagenome]
MAGLGIRSISEYVNALPNTVRECARKTN